MDPSVKARPRPSVLVLGALFFLIALVLDLLYVLVAGLLSNVLGPVERAAT